MSKKAKPAWMPWYVNDFLADTTAYSAQQIGAYALMLMHQWRKGSLPNDAARVVEVARAPQEVVEPILTEHFQQDEGGGWINERLAEERLRYFAVVESRRAGAKKTNAHRAAERTDNRDGDRPAQRSGERTANRDAQGSLIGGESESESEKDTSSKSNGKRKPSKKAPGDYEPSEELLGQMRTECPLVDLQAELKKFKDHTFKDPRVDWDATLRNWYRTAQERKAEKNQTGGLFSDPNRGIEYR